MRHFSEKHWADYVRGVDPTQTAAKIKSHLAANCSSCQTTQGIWGRFRAATWGEPRFAPPENLVRLIKLEFSARAASAQVEEAKPSLAALIFDSLRQPLTAGVRAAAASGRQLIYEGDDLTVDLRLDRALKSSTVSLVGQILDKKLPSGSLNGAPVVIWTSDGQLIATTEANQFGEFHLEFESQPNLRLTVRVGSRKVQIPLTSPE